MDSIINIINTKRIELHNLIREVDVKISTILRDEEYKEIRGEIKSIIEDILIENTCKFKEMKKEICQLEREG